MSTAYQISAGDHVYTVVDDVTSLYAAVITGVVTDEMLGNIPIPGFTVEVSRPDLVAKTEETGLYAVTGYPNLAFPKLSSTSYTIDLVLKAPGFQDQDLAVIIPANATLPVTAAAAALRRLPVRIQGRVVQDSTRQPISGALVVGVDNPNPPSPPPPPPVQHTTLLRSPLYFPHAPGVKVQQVILTSVGSAKLTQPAPAGTQLLNLTTTAGLAGSAFVQLSTPSLVLVEYATVDHLGSQPGQVFLRNPLNSSYLPGTTNVQFFTAAPGASSGNLILDAGVGDGIVVADSLLNVGTVVVDPASATAIEYHEIGAISDGDGYYAFNGIGRVPELFLEANPPGTPVVAWFIEFDKPVNVVDFRL